MLKNHTEVRPCMSNYQKKVDLAISNVFGMIELNIFFFRELENLVGKLCNLQEKVINGGHDQKVIFD